MNNKLKYRIMQLCFYFFILVGILSAVSIFVAQIIEFPLLNIGYGSFAVSVIVVIAMIKPMNKIRETVEYDEFGAPKKGKYDLSKEERRALDVQLMANVGSILSNPTKNKIVHPGEKHPEKAMEKLIGLAPVKEKMEEMVARIQFERGRNDMPRRHMVFYGAPGTGKTTVARIMTGFLYQNKYIKENKCIEIDGNILKSGTPGDTATKTRMLVRLAYGGVLFIDEAYSLANEGDGCGDEAVATLLKEMEDNRDKFVLILAGYTDEMQNMLNKNPGFKSRIKEYLTFPNYNATELREILRLKAGEKGLAIDGEAYDVFDERMRKEARLNSYGNARTVENVLDDILDRHALNFSRGKISAEEKYKILACDVPIQVKTML